ncbi:hypothetical protein ZWY2020_059321 [Hordeum vulgare]|nr:hypothetical protein ZWY2020_059321 [Hordeum vulgare]
MSGAGGADEPLSGDQKREIAVWFLANAPADEIHYVAKDVRALLGDDAAYEAAAAEAYPEYNKTHLVSLELPDRSGDMLAFIHVSPQGRGRRSQEKHKVLDHWS